MLLFHLVKPDWMIQTMREINTCVLAKLSVVHGISVNFQQPDLNHCGYQGQWIVGFHE